jgi:predicted ribosomally synthesized peptide with SipW-like signal peptide
MGSKHARLGRVLASARTRAALSLGVVLAVGSTGTFAYWTDDVTVSGTNFTAGKLDLQVNNSDTLPAYTTLPLDKMVPGNSVAATLLIRNNGNVPLKYTAAVNASNLDNRDLSGSLIVKVTADTTTTGSAPAVRCQGVALPGSGSSVNGSLIPTGRLLAPGAPELQPAPDSTETLCVQVTLATNAPSILQGATAKVGFTFTGTSELS